MSLTVIHWMRSTFLLTCLVAQLLFQSPSAEAAASALNCSVTRELNGSFKHKLSQRPTSSECKTCWEDQNKIVIALDSTSDPELVQDLTDQFIILRACHDYLHYTRDCFGVWEEADCRVNCSIYFGRPSNAGNSHNVSAGVIMAVVAAAIFLL